MEADRTRRDDLDVRLQWPDSGPLAAERRKPYEEGREAARTSLWRELERASADRPAVVDPNVGSTALRLDALASAIGLLRGVLSEQLSDHSNQVLRAVSLNGRDLDEYNRDHTRSLSEVERVVRDNSDATERIERNVDAKLDQVGQVTEAVQAIEGQVDQLAETLTTDLERILEILEDQQLADRMESLESRVESLQALVETAAAIPGQLAALQHSLDVLRRRVALRARAEMRLDEDSIAQVAIAVAQILREPAPSANTGTATSRRRPKRV